MTYIVTAIYAACFGACLLAYAIGRGWTIYEKSVNKNKEEETDGR